MQWLRLLFKLSVEARLAVRSASLGSWSINMDQIEEMLTEEVLKR